MVKSIFKSKGRTNNLLSTTVQSRKKGCKHQNHYVPNRSKHAVLFVPFFGTVDFKTKAVLCESMFVANSAFTRFTGQLALKEGAEPLRSFVVDFDSEGVRKGANMNTHNLAYFTSMDAKTVTSRRRSDAPGERRNEFFLFDSPLCDRQVTKNMRRSSYKT